MLFGNVCRLPLVARKLCVRSFMRVVLFCFGDVVCASPAPQLAMAAVWRLFTKRFIRGGRFRQAMLGFWGELPVPHVVLVDR